MYQWKSEMKSQANEWTTREGQEVLADILQHLETIARWKMGSLAGGSTSAEDLASTVMAEMVWPAIVNQAFPFDDPAKSPREVFKQMTSMDGSNHAFYLHNAVRRAVSCIGRPRNGQAMTLQMFSDHAADAACSADERVERTEQLAKISGIIQQIKSPGFRGRVLEAMAHRSRMTNQDVASMFGSEGLSAVVAERAEDVSGSARSNRRTRAMAWLGTRLNGVVASILIAVSVCTGVTLGHDSLIMEGTLARHENGSGDSAVARHENGSADSVVPRHENGSADSALARHENGSADSVVPRHENGSAGFAVISGVEKLPLAIGLPRHENGKRFA